MNKSVNCFIFILIMSASLSIQAEDQCNTTAECREQYGNAATDCANSGSNNSVCMCGNIRCDAQSPSISIPGTVQTEDYAGFFDTTPGNAGNAYRNDDVDIQATTDSGGGYNIGWIDSSEWLEFPINVTQSGEYEAKARVASLPGNGMFTLQLDGSTLGSTFTVGATGSWQNWTTLTGSRFFLNTGRQTLRFQVQNGGFNINWIELKRTNVPGGTLGRFNKGRDMFLANFDGKPDVDDFHSVAGVSTMLRDSRFAGINYHAVAGAIGRQGGIYVAAPTLFNMAFGNSNWSSAANNWNAAVNTVTNKAVATLNAGGDLWIAEAGQSDFSADVVRQIKSRLPGINTKNRVHLVQHSEWNQNQTTPSDLNYVRQNTDYIKIPDGNAVGNGSPGFFAKNAGSEWGRVISNGSVGNIWREARRVANDNNGSTGYNNPAIAAGGFDFSDVSETTWIFGFNGLRNVYSYFDEFL